MAHPRYSTSYPKMGQAHVFVNEHFTAYPPLSSRKGAAKDVQLYRQLFEKCGLQVHIHKDLTCAETMDILKMVAKDQARKLDSMVVVAFSTHGDQSDQKPADELYCTDTTQKPADELYCTDTTLRLRHITCLFNDTNCKAMAGKPKLFFLQACRGMRLDETVERTEGVCEVKTMSMINSYSATVEIPIFKDFYIAYSSPPGHISMRSETEGSWFVKCLHDVITEEVNNHDLVSLLTMVRYKIAVLDKEYVVTNPPQGKPYLENRKITPWAASMLTKEVWFRK